MRTAIRHAAGYLAQLRCAPCAIFANCSHRGSAPEICPKNMRCRLHTCLQLGMTCKLGDHRVVSANSRAAVEQFAFSAHTLLLWASRLWQSCVDAQCISVLPYLKYRPYEMENCLNFHSLCKRSTWHFNLSAFLSLHHVCRIQCHRQFCISLLLSTAPQFSPRCCKSKEANTPKATRTHQCTQLSYILSASCR